MMIFLYELADLDMAIPLDTHKAKLHEIKILKFGGWGQKGYWPMTDGDSEKLK